MKHLSTLPIIPFPPRSRHFVLRIWQPPIDLSQRFTIQDGRTGRQRHFKTLKQAIDWLTTAAAQN
ncbi:MAG TPA: hypothetical protein ENJ56_04750 [Anaerolineae bacterium]|nr:hypothetical protein [Anaerolineae bacterium]